MKTISYNWCNSIFTQSVMQVGFEKIFEYRCTIYIQIMATKTSILIT